MYVYIILKYGEIHFFIYTLMRNLVKEVWL